MPQPNEPGYSSGFLPHLDEPSRAPLTVQELERLYVLTDWRIVLLDKRIGKPHQRLLTVSLFKALALPFLINIPSERALVRELADREPLQALCGFWPGKTPKRATFWDFRSRYADIYPDLMLHVLIALVLGGPEPVLTLPFVITVPQTAGDPSGRYSEFQLDAYRPSIEIWTTAPGMEVESLVDTAGKTWIELRDEIATLEKAHGRPGPRKRGIAGGLGLPAEVRTRLHNGQTVCFGIDKPAWIDSRTRQRQADPLITVGPASSRPNVTCHVLVLREYKAREQVLLGRRLAGYGKGAYMLPGGKQRPDESLQACAARELWEETGIRILKSRPVSLHNNRLPGKPRVLSVGVLAEAHEGQPQRREPNQNAEWEWHDLEKLPEPLFEPARIALSHYIRGTYSGLQWSDVEFQTPEGRDPPKQLKLSI